jgi:hypothetical protein
LLGIYYVLSVNEKKKRWFMSSGTVQLLVMCGDVDKLKCRKAGLWVTIFYKSFISCGSSVTTTSWISWQLLHAKSGFVGTL